MPYEIVQKKKKKYYKQQFDRLQCLNFRINVIKRVPSWFYVNFPLFKRSIFFFRGFLVTIYDGTTYWIFNLLQRNGRCRRLKNCNFFYKLICYWQWICSALGKVILFNVHISLISRQDDFLTQRSETRALKFSQQFLTNSSRIGFSLLYILIPGFSDQTRCFTRKTQDFLLFIINR